MEPQPSPTRKRKRPESQDAFDEKIANLSLDDFPTPPGVNSFGGVYGQKFAEPGDAASAGPSKENQVLKKRAPISKEEKMELYCLDHTYFKALYGSKSYQENEWPAHLYWCRRKFWEHYYRAHPDQIYPEPPQSPENQMAILRREYANRPPWWFPGFPSIETRAKYPTAWKHYEEDNQQPASPAKRDLEERDLEERILEEHAQLAMTAWELMTNEQLEELLHKSEAYCKTEREKIGATTEVIMEYSQAILDMKKRCGRWQARVDYVTTHGILRVKAFLRARLERELVADEKEPERKKRRTD
ncbi:hypothetical protein V501_06998 [Pseudogymnoascus sp. VKM F-4519 (FW-2642)]|nr:hypothetical protein V501_06998 [Pseudogymnoascus sp. VKM F-4519 (FW-2642)]